ncbi:MAG: hypothetical protein BMS9Abin01_1531 [Gammaproteobacteria bacterium]|nr:MAG: hypothetical protein BMS9Abin01_1531 [Gammaproteobacteria bacterium]
MVRPACSGTVSNTVRGLPCGPYRHWGMKRIRALSFALAALTGFAAGLPVIIHADDTEIYVGNSAFSDNVVPNILLILDTSGSMRSFDGGTVSRLDRVKTALTAILDEVTNVNIGLARFHDRGGPILFPVSDLNSDVADVESGIIPEVNRRLAGSANDAEEHNASGAVILDSGQLEMTETLAHGVEMSFVAAVGDSRDDAEQLAANLGYNDGKNTMDCCATLNGLRFPTIPIPPGSTVTRATLQLVANVDGNAPTTINILGQKVVNALPFSPPPSADDVWSRRTDAPTVARVMWSNVPDWIGNDRYTSPNLRSIVQEIIDQGGWAENNSLVLLLGGTGSREARTFDFGGASSAAQLFLEWVKPPVAAGPQTIGLRFEDVRIPQRMGIKSAFIEFYPREDGVGNAALRVRAEASGDSAPFTATANNLTDNALRPKTRISVLWNPPSAEWKAGVAYQTTDLTTIVREVVNRGDWCGGNAMTFFIDDLGSTGPRIATSADGNPSRAPILRIDFDKTQPPGPGQGCTIQEISARPSISADDANQVIASVDPATPLNTANNLVQFEAGLENGLRFQGLEIPPGVEITAANIVFKAASTTPASASADRLDITFEGHATDTAVAFSTGANTDVISRTPPTSTVTWTTVPAWVGDTTYTSPDLSSIVSEIVNGPTGWVSGNDLAIVMSSSGPGKRFAIAKVFSAADAPLLRISMRAKIGDLPSIPVTTVRQRLKQIVGELDHAGYTPIVDTLYEAAVYYRGENVTWGLNRGNGRSSLKRTTRVSHPSSYVGGTVVRDPGCTDINLNADECLSEEIQDGPTYISPINTPCQANFIVLLTDGIANRNSSEQLIRNITGDTSCDNTLPGGERCGIELTRYLNDPSNDQNPNVAGNNTITTYTIGLEISNQWLKDLATEGGGKFFQAGSTAELRRTFNDIVSDVLQRTTSFATPSLSINAFNQLLHLDEVYLSLFEPRLQVAWPGNVKKYRICQSVNDGCEPGTLLDATPPPGGPNAAVGADGRILDSARSFWSPAPDGAEVLQGGAGAQIPNHPLRRIYTYTGTVDPSNEDLVGGGHQIADIDSDGILDGLTGGTADELLQRTKDLLGWPGPPVAALPDAAARAQLVTELNQHINWIRGQDVDDEDLDGNRTEDRYSFADPLHSSPVAFTIGGDAENPVVKFVVGTNDGAIRLTNGFNGREEFVFYPQSVLPQLVRLRTNANGKHAYGVDGTATVWLNDVNNDGIIARDDGDFARVFIGMRRGGNDIFALDITPANGTGLGATDRGVTNSINPVYSWRIRGGGTQYPRLGQTWSRPQLATVTLGNWPTPGEVSPATMLLFAGGYDDSQDSGFGPGGLGNAIYMANPLNGERMLSISTNDPTGGSPDKTVLPPAAPGEATMNFPIPSDLALVDTNGDSSVNRILVGDTGGQLWRVDLAPSNPNDPATPVDSRVRAVVGMLATVSSNETLADQRKFFEPPDVVQVRAGQGVSSVANFDQVNIVSGNRANPLNLTVQDRFYAFRDVVIGNLSDDGVGSPLHAVPSGFTGDGIADGFTTFLGALDSPLRDGDLFDVTNVVDPGGTDLANLQAANGYYLDFEAPGEKGLSSPITLEGKLVFTTYLPEAVVNLAACSLAEGEGAAYGINVLNGSAIFNWDESPDTDPLSVADRKLTLGAGIPSSAVPIFTQEEISLLIGTSSGTKTLKTGIKLPRQRTFWFEESNL